MTLLSKNVRKHGTDGLKEFLNEKHFFPDDENPAMLDLPGKGNIHYQFNDMSYQTVLWTLKQKFFYKTVTAG
jgi:hypothetical protein